MGEMLLLIVELIRNYGELAKETCSALPAPPVCGKLYIDCIEIFDRLGRTLLKQHKSVTS